MANNGFYLMRIVQGCAHNWHNRRRLYCQAYLYRFSKIRSKTGNAY